MNAELLVSSISRFIFVFSYLYPFTNLQHNSKSNELSFTNIQRNSKLNELNPFPKQALVFTCLQYKCFENTVGRGEIARNEQFLLFPQCFLPEWRAFCHFQ